MLPSVPSPCCSHPLLTGLSMFSSACWRKNRAEHSNYKVHQKLSSKEHKTLSEALQEPRGSPCPISRCVNYRVWASTAQRTREAKHVIVLPVGVCVAPQAHNQTRRAWRWLQTWPMLTSYPLCVQSQSRSCCVRCLIALVSMYSYRHIGKTILSFSPPESDSVANPSTGYEGSLDDFTARSE